MSGGSRSWVVGVWAVERSSGRGALAHTHKRGKHTPRAAAARRAGRVRVLAAVAGVAHGGRSPLGGDAYLG